MRTGTTRPFRRPALLVVALLSGLILVTMAGCADSSPGAVPTSTLPAQQPSDNSSNAAAEVDVPDYETDLDLSAEEKKAVDGALVAFEGFIQAINSAYSGTPEAADNFPKIASGDALKSIQDEAASIAAEKATFEGEIEPLKVDVFKIKADEDAAKPSTLLVNFCVDTSKWTMTQAGESSTPNPDGKVTMQHTILRTKDGWKVDQQTLWERSC